MVRFTEAVCPPPRPLIVTVKGVLVVGERLLRVRVLVSPTLISVGSKLHDAALEAQPRVILSVKPLADEAETVYVGVVSEDLPT